MRFNCINAVQTFTCIANKRYVFDLYGASGQSDGGTGGHVQAIYSHTANITLNLYVGGNYNDSDAYWTGGWNGGGAGGRSNTSGTDYYGNPCLPGSGGGGATDIRSGGTAVGNRILVAGGGGGAGGGDWNYGHGGKYPETNRDGDAEYLNEYGAGAYGGKRGTLNAAGAGGVTPSYAGDAYDYSYDCFGNYFFYGGGGGGGGYYGGGGGSTGIVQTAFGGSSSGTAGGNGGQGTGGAGGSKANVQYGYGCTSGGGGGGGSSYIASNAQLSYGIYDQSSNDGLGYILVSEVISAPIITGIRRDGNAIYVKVSKEERDDNKDIEERFYYTWALDPTDGQFTRKRDPKNSVVVLNDEEVELKYTIGSGTSAGYHKLYFSITSADERREETYMDFAWNDVAPTLTFNEEALSSVLLQGTEVENAFVGTGMFSNAVNLIYKKKLIINGNEFGNEQEGTDTSIFLPYIYNGVYDEIYTFKIKVKVGQMANGLHGTGREIWSDWFESDEYTVYAPVIPINKVYFKTKLDHTAIERHTKLTIEWASNDKFLEPGEYDYILSMYKDDELLYEQNYKQETQAKIVMSYPQGENYRFGIALLKNNIFMSDINYSDSFNIAEMTSSNKIALSDDLVLTTTLDTDFNKIEIRINDNLEYVSEENINIAIPNWKLQNGHNTINIYLYITETIYIKHTYKVFMHVLSSDLINAETHKIDVYTSINNESNYTKMIEEDTQAIKLGISEKEFEGKLQEELVQEINQRITIKNNGVDFELKIIEILGGLE